MGVRFWAAGEWLLSTHCSRWPRFYAPLMDSRPDWLDEVVLLNESRSVDAAGDVSIYRSEGEACAAVEAWWVKNSEGFAFTATGVRLVLGVGSKGAVVIVRREPCPEGPAIVRAWLEALMQTTLSARKMVASEGKSHLSEAEVAGALPTSVEGMIAYVGFPWVPPNNRFAFGCLALLATIATLLIVLVIRLS